MLADYGSLLPHRRLGFRPLALEHFVKLLPASGQNFLNDQSRKSLGTANCGNPADRKAVQDAIIEITNKVGDEREFNISFLTVGKIDSGLEAFLTSLDDDLKGAKYDIVDVKKLDDVDFISAFAGALND
jgi:hypothetical protein